MARGVNLARGFISTYVLRVSLVQVHHVQDVGVSPIVKYNDVFEVFDSAVEVLAYSTAVEGPHSSGRIGLYTGFVVGGVA